MEERRSADRSKWENKPKNRWLKPRAIQERLYQKEILRTAKEKNTLVVLPTALGKTVIALLLAIERVKNGKIFFLAPTKPLVRQHHQTFRDKTFFEERELTLVTGRDPPEKRRALYNAGNLFFATPQCVNNDLKSGRITLKDVSLIIFDEAHRARGHYTYVSIANYYFTQSKYPLVLGLTASPGGSKEKIIEVCGNLGIEAIEFRVDDDDDVKLYIQSIDVAWKRVQLPESYVKVREKLREMMVERIKGLQTFGVLVGKKATYITRRDLIELNRELQKKIADGERGYLYQLKVQATATLSIMHMMMLIETQGPKMLKSFIEKSLKRMALEGSRGHKSIVNDPLFTQASIHLKTCLSDENPKITELVKILNEQIRLDQYSRMIVFSEYRDTIRVILNALKSGSTLRIGRFVGQGERIGDPGMTQAQQSETLRKLRKGEINVLVATSIAEEGLDIPEVNHVVFYEPVPSEIRYIQRRGRTGRKVAGKVTILIAEQTLDEAFYWSSINKVKKMKKTIYQLNKQLPNLLRAKRYEKVKLTNFQPQKDLEVGTTKKREKTVWKPQNHQTKGLSRALEWLNKNIPHHPTSIAELVDQATEEIDLKEQVIKTAIWRLLEEGQLYQPEPGKIHRL